MSGRHLSFGNNRHCLCDALQVAVAAGGVPAGEAGATDHITKSKLHGPAAGAGAESRRRWHASSSASQPTATVESFVSRAPVAPSEADEPATAISPHTSVPESQEPFQQEQVDASSVERRQQQHEIIGR